LTDSGLRLLHHTDAASCRTLATRRRNVSIFFRLTRLRTIRAMETPVNAPGTGPEKSWKDGRGKSEGSKVTQKRGNAAVQEARDARLAAEARAAMPDDPGAETLDALRHVAHMPNSRDKDKGHLVGVFRAVQEKNPVKFAEMLIAEEEKAAERNGSKCRCCGWADSDLDEDGNPPPEQERIAEMNRTMAAMRPIHLKRIQEEKAKEAATNAELAARPDAAQVGAARQAALRESVLREGESRERCNRLWWEHDLPFRYDPEESVMDDMRLGAAHRNALLALKANPEQHLLTLERALEDSKWCEQMAEEHLAELEDRLRKLAAARASEPPTAA